MWYEPNTLYAMDPSKVNHGGTGVNVAVSNAAQSTIRMQAFKDAMIDIVVVIVLYTAFYISGCAVYKLVQYLRTGKTEIMKSNDDKAVETRRSDSDSDSYSGSDSESDS